MKKKHLFILSILLSLTACVSSTTSSSSGSSLDESSSSSNVKEDLSLNYELKDPDFSVPKRNNKDEFTFDDFFNLGNTVVINVDVSMEELDKLQADYQTGFKSEVYHLADHVEISITNHGNTFTWEYDNVGLRQKGNTSRQNIYSHDKKTLNQNHYKLAFDETFTDTNIYDSTFISKYGNEEYENREFLGVSGIDIKWNKNYDMTHIKEAYSSYLFRAAGIITPRVGLAKMCFNFEGKTYDFGLCMTYEKASKSLIKNALKEESVVTMGNWNEEKKGTFGVPDENYGDLYKCSYGVGNGGSSGPDLTLNSISGEKVGVGNLTGSYIPTYERKTNEDVSYNDNLLKNMVLKLNGYISSYEEIEEYVDLDYLAIEEAVAYIIGNPDAMRYNYNNYMIYFRRTDGKAIIIPIDNDRCFGITRDWNVRDAIKDDKILSKQTSNDNQRNPLLNKTIFVENTRCQNLYLDYVNKIINSKWVLNETFERYYNMAKESYKNFENDNDFYKFSLEDSNISFKTYMESKIKASKIQNTNEVIDNLYIVGTFNNWGDYSSSELPLYKMEHLGNGVYKVEVKIQKVESENNKTYIKFKFNNGYNDYSKIDWTLSSDLKSLVKDVGKSVYLYDVKVNDVLTVIVNTKTNAVSVEVN